MYKDATLYSTMLCAYITQNAYQLPADESEIGMCLATVAAPVILSDHGWCC